MNMTQDQKVAVAAFIFAAARAASIEAFAGYVDPKYKKQVDSDCLKAHMAFNAAFTNDAKAE